MLFVPGLLLASLLLLLLLLLLYVFRRPRRHAILGDKFPGQRAYPIVGNALQTGTSTADLYTYLMHMYKEFYGSAFRIWAGNRLNVFLTTPKDIEVLLSDQNQLKKSSMYDFFNSWLGHSIVTSTGPQWKQTRKFLSTVFTKKKLEDYVETFNVNAEILVDILKDQAGGPAFNMQHFSSLNAIDNMSETFMGMNINAMRDADSKYVQAVHKQCEIVVERTFKPWLQPDFIFNLTSWKRSEVTSLEILHGTTDKAIKLRRKEIIKKLAAEKNETSYSDDLETRGGRNTGNYVDVLIRSTFEGSNLTDKNIRGEVGTVGFAGQDTISVCVAFALWNLAWNPTIQDTVVAEIDKVWTDSEVKLSYLQLQELQYLDRVLKETLRLYPSLPVIGRNIHTDTEFQNDLVAPKGADVLVGIYLVHRDPAYYPDPEKFDPDRFLPENVQGRSPYAYIPFSMGPRVCPGAKFAMVEMKCTIAHVLRNYKILPGSKTKNLKLSLEPIVSVKEGIPVKIVLRE